jgi:drug/metabolite transporter (DMT)-like permease
MLVAPSLMKGFHATTLGLLAVTVAALCYGVNIVYTKKFLRGLPGLVGPTAQLSMASLILLPISFATEQPLAMPMPSILAAGSVIALAVIGTALAFIVYYRLLETTPASALAMVTYLIPVFGVLLGVLVLDEKLQWNAYAGFVLILCGVMVVNGAVRWPFPSFAKKDVT